MKCLGCFGSAIEPPSVGPRETVQPSVANPRQEARKARAHGQVEGVEAVLVEELVGIEEAAGDRVVLKVDAQLLQALDLALDDSRAGGTPDAIGEHAAAGEERFEHGNVEALARELASAGDARGARAHDGNLFAVGRLALGSLAHLVGHVAEHALELANCHGLALAAKGLHLPSHWFSCGHTRPQTEGSRLSALMVASAPAQSSSRSLDELRDMDAYRAAVHAERLLAVEAAVCLGDGIGLGVARVDRAEIMSALLCGLLIRGGAGSSDIGRYFTSGMRSPPHDA